MSLDPPSHDPTRREWYFILQLKRPPRPSFGSETDQPLSRPRTYTHSSHVRVQAYRIGAASGGGPETPETTLLVMQGLRVSQESFSRATERQPHGPIP